MMSTCLQWVRAALVASICLYQTAVSGATCSEPSESGLPALALKEVASGLVEPVHIAAAPGVPGRLYIVEQKGRIRIVENGSVKRDLFLDITDRVESGGEKGLLSIAFHPGFKTNGVFFVNYTARDRSGLHSRVSQFRAETAGTADGRSELILIRVPQPYSNHNGGQIAFGPDAFLYIGMGDGGSANDPQRHAQSPGSLLGKLLRIDVNRRGTTANYSIPDDNPFAAVPGYRSEIWALGLRNPWRFSFDAANGSLWLADVGQDKVEEIDVVHRGGNYGWPVMEGNRCNTAVTKNCNVERFIGPVYTYNHPDGFSITGGYVYRGAAIPRLCGAYLFADYVTQKIWAVRFRDGTLVESAELLSRRGAISSFGQDNELELYVADHRSGKILQLIEK